MILSGKYPELTKVCHMGDCVFSFDLENGQSGYTRDKQTFHVYDPAANAFTSYTKAELDNLGKINYSGYTNNSGITNKSFNTNATNKLTFQPDSSLKYLPVGLFALGALILFMNKH
jgi:hypothetical protein